MSDANATASQPQERIGLLFVHGVGEATRFGHLSSEVTNLLDALEKDEKDEKIERLNVHTEISRDGITEINEAGEIVFVSPSVERVWGYTQAELVGRNYKDRMIDVVHPDDLDLAFSEFDDLRESGETGQFTTCRVRSVRDGSWPRASETTTELVASRTSLSTREWKTLESSARALLRAESISLPAAAPVT